MPTRKYSGRLELTWTNKRLRLLANRNEGYEWVTPHDYRVSEVRLLRDAALVGRIGATDSRSSDNLLIRGDALNALVSLSELPEFASEYVGRIRLAYIDPPFNTGQAFEDYDDNLEHSVWLTMIRDRLLQIRRLLSDDGSVWLHLDDVQMHRARCVLDEVFGASNFVANVIWQKTHTRENRTDISISHDNLIVYAVDRTRWTKARNLLPPSDAQRNRYSNPDDDPRGDWASMPVHAKAEKGRRKEQFFTITLPSGRRVDSPPGTCWRFTRERYEEVVADGRIWFGEGGDSMPRLKKFWSEVPPGLVPTSIWSHGEVGTTGTAKGEILALFPGLTPFSTPKPEALIERIIHIGSNPGEVVLDCFLGSGTTAAVAHKMGRRWAGVEWREDTVRDFAMPRLGKVVEGNDPGGVTDLTGWRGGGGFRVVDVAPSMFEESDGVVYLSDWAVNGALAEATAAQLGFAYQPEHPFVGRKGRSRLAVIDGHVSSAVTDLLAGALGSRETLVICATSVDPAVRPRVHAAAPGSVVRKIPASILAEYRVNYRERRRRELARSEEPEEASA
ncbi:MAG: site-specific DNA-methyltransferase [Acidobacteria bacterium]|nr:site-specific DNA-methyltransferase [Acidobacteriota bacterium]MYH22704.1 site-specific DNA-methyltransferase [Acidobacteriota bacterium]MYK80718.1 site-specific DNA-methyltransferase [Acidobacteriota bacterium]